MFEIKICGVTTVQDALAAAEAGADAIGLNFFPGSSRWVDEQTASAIVHALPADVMKVGVFVNSADRLVLDIYDQIGLDLIQLHGDEPPEYLGALGNRPTLKAFRCAEDGLAPALAYLERCRELGRMPEMVLMDAFRPGHYGGTGATINWLTLVDHQTNREMPPLVLAGGLRAETVAEAIAMVEPMAVDTASGVESSPGHKDPALIAAFVNAARQAFDRLAETRRP